MNDDEGYMKLTSNLSNSYESVFGDIFDCVLTGIVDKDVKDGRIVSSVRKLVFRDDGYVEAGCRFKPNAVPEYIECPEDSKEMARLVVETLKEGMRKSQSNPVSKSEFEKLSKKETKDFVSTKVDTKAEEEEVLKFYSGENEEEEVIEVEEVEEETERIINRDEALATIKKNVKKVATLAKKLIADEGVDGVGKLSNESLKELLEAIDK